MNLLVIAAHPDDETLGCGGTLARLIREGNLVRVAFMADGVGSRAEKGVQDIQALESRQEAASKACEVLGAPSPIFNDYPDNRLDTLPLLEIVQSIEILITKYQPDTILTHHFGDLNIDHQIVHKAVFTACRPQTGYPVQTLLTFETPSSTEWQTPVSARSFVPNWFVDITDTLEQKIMAAQCYVSELRQWPHPRSEQGLRHLAHWRGATVGVEAAEAFMLGRHCL